MENKNLNIEPSIITDLVSKLSNNKDFLFQILMNLPVGVQIYDSNGFSYFINEKQRELIGIPDITTGVGKFNILNDPFSTSQGINLIFEKAYQGKKQHHIFEYDLKPSNNSWNLAKEKIIVNQTIIPIFDNDGKVIFVVSINEDYTEKLKIEKQLTESKELFNAFYNGAFGGIFLHHQGNIIICNKGLEEITGYQQKELIGMNAFELIDKTSWSIAQEYMQKGYEIPYEAIGIRKNGEKYPVRINAKNIIYKGLNCRISEITDITEEKKLIDKEKATQELFSSVVNQAFESLIIYDLNGKVVEVNQSTIKTLGYTKEELKGMTIFDIQHEITQEEFFRKYQKLNFGERILLNTKYRKKGNILFPVEVSYGLFMTNEKVNLIALANDISEKENLNLRIKKTEEIKNAVFDASPLAIYTINLEGYVLTWNKSAERIFGWTEEEVIGKFLPIVQDYQFIEFRSIMDDVQSNKKVIGKEIIRKRKDGSLISISLSLAPIKDSSGRLSGILAIAEDISEKNIIKNRLALSEKNYRLLFFSNPLPMLIYNIYNYRIIEVNDAAIKKYGWGKNEFLNLNYKDIIQYDDTNTPFDLFKFNEQNNSKTQVFKHKDKYGNLYFVETITHKINYLSQEANLVLIYDITEKILSENQLKANEEKFRKLFDDHAAIKLIIDPNNGKIIDANKSAINFYGYSREEILNMTIHQINILTPQEIQAEMERAKQYKKNFFEFKHKLKNGSIVDVEVFSSKVEIDNNIYLHSIIHDVTQKRKLENKIRLLNRAVDQAGFSILITDVNGNVEYVNNYFSVHSEYTYDEIIGKNIRILNSGHHPKEFFKNLWETIKSKKDWSGEICNRSKKGEIYWINTIISPILNDRGEISNFIAIRENITEKKKLMQELLEAKAKAEESNLLKTAFINNISHEIRTPLNAIIGFGQILVNENLSNDEKKEYLKYVNKSCDRLIQTVNDYLDISLIVAGSIKVRKFEVIINNLIEDIFDYANALIENKSIKVILDTPFSNKIITIISDEALIIKTLKTIINNAAKFTNQGTITIGYKLEDRAIIFFVKDTGIGIHEDKHKLIFEPFYQEDHNINRDFEGNGLGLSIAKGFVELLNGCIYFESQVEVGSNFYVKIPTEYTILDEFTISDD